mmetsp:Transcript_20838/g.51684  ORF Transcript_20838/g.51684 Transcript_20838/m.51684 type:complete len:207 (-) Transcript_20838:989-1609(-)
MTGWVKNNICGINDSVGIWFCSVHITVCSVNVGPAIRLGFFALWMNIDFHRICPTSLCRRCRPNALKIILFSLTWCARLCRINPSRIGTQHSRFVFCFGRRVARTSITRLTGFFATFVVIGTTWIQVYSVTIRNTQIIHCRAGILQSLPLEIKFLVFDWHAVEITNCFLEIFDGAVWFDENRERITIGGANIHTNVICFQINHISV